MYFGRQVVLRPCRQLIPVTWIARPRQQQHPVADGRQRSIQRREFRDFSLQQETVQVLLHARRVSARQKKCVMLVGGDIAPGDWPAEFVGCDHPSIELPGLGIRAQSTEHDALQQQRIAGSDRRPLRRENNLVAGIDKQPPRHRHLGGVEIGIRQRDQDAGHAGETIPQRPRRVWHTCPRTLEWALLRRLDPPCTCTPP